MRSKLHNLKASQGASRSLGTATTPGRNSVPGALRSGTSNVPSLREGARLLAVSRLKAASEAAGRLTGKQDSEALHDFRVNLRRLRVCLRSYRGVLGGAMPLRAVKRAKKIARLTAVARDAEVFSRWIESWEKFIKPDEKPGVEAFRCWLPWRAGPPRNLINVSRKLKQLKTTRQYIKPGSPARNCAI
ncbi:MAG: CHAD domain-containing protein [Elusimicrobia bacterium]|nr:CHAD domain-containing protein [Elusimicrobiota bacterium]